MIYWFETFSQCNFVTSIFICACPLRNNNYLEQGWREVYVKWNSSYTYVPLPSPPFCVQSASDSYSAPLKTYILIYYKLEWWHPLLSPQPPIGNFLKPKFWYQRVCTTIYFHNYRSMNHVLNINLELNSPYTYVPPPAPLRPPQSPNYKTVPDSYSASWKTYILIYHKPQS